MTKRESGFTLVEAMIAIVVLVFGLVAIAQLFVVASQSNVTARKATAAADASTQVMDMLMAAPFDTVSAAAGGSVDISVMTLSGAPETFDVKNYKLLQKVPGVGPVLTCWEISNLSTDLVAIHVRSQVMGLMSGLTRAEFTTMRAKVERPTGAAS
jgi:type II secretory pathway pseudopilin PulG